MAFSDRLIALTNAIAAAINARQSRTGASAYEIAVVNGYSGTQAQWLASLQGGSATDASTTAKGIVQLAGDLAGTAASPTVPALTTKANIASPTFTGTPTAPTATAGDNSTTIATTAFVSSSQGGIKAVTNQSANYTLALSDAGTLIQVSTATTVTIPTDATVAFPIGTTIQVLASSGSNNVTIIVASGVSVSWNHSTVIYPGNRAWLIKTASNYWRILESAPAPLMSPAFTNTPTAPTATAGTSTTQLATTAFVTTADNLKANLASPTFTGTPLAPTAAANTNTTQIATTAYVRTAIDNVNGTGSISYSTNKSVDGRTALIRSGNIVTFIFVLIASDGFSIDGTICTLPTGFRPLQDMFLNCGVYNGGWQGMAVVYISQAGNIALKTTVTPNWSSAASSSNAQLLGSTSFTATL